MCMDDSYLISYIENQKLLYMDIVHILFIFNELISACQLAIIVKYAIIYVSLGLLVEY